MTLVEQTPMDANFFAFNSGLEHLAEKYEPGILKGFLPARPMWDDRGRHVDSFFVQVEVGVSKELFGHIEYRIPKFATSISELRFVPSNGSEDHWRAINQHLYPLMNEIAIEEDLSARGFSYLTSLGESSTIPRPFEYNDDLAHVTDIMYRSITLLFVAPESVEDCLNYEFIEGPTVKQLLDMTSKYNY